MARILVIYGTTNGHTGKIARFIGERLRTRGAEVDVVDAGVAAPDPNEYSAIVVAASVHAGRYQKRIARWVAYHRDALSRRPTAFVSSCLGVLQRDVTVKRAVAANVERFLADTGWRPALTKSVAGALLYTQYSWFIRWMMKRIAAKAGGDTDTRRDCEYTNWNDVAAFTYEFARLAGVERPTSRTAALA